MPRSQRLIIFGASACLGASLLSGCTASEAPNKVLTAIDCDDPKNNGGMSVAGEVAAPIVPADHELDNGSAIDTQLGNLPIKGLSVFLSDQRMQQLTSQHPSRVYRISYQRSPRQEEEGQPIIELLNFSSKGTTYSSHDDKARHANRGWYLEWDPEVRGLSVESYTGDAVQKAIRCQAYDIDPHDINDVTTANVSPKANKICKDTPTQISGYRAVTAEQARILCAAAAAIQPFDKQGTLKALIEKENKDAITLSKASGYYVRDSQTIVNPDNFLKFPQHKLTEQIRPIHEWTHHIYYKALQHSSKNIADIGAAYDAMATNKDELSNNKIFNVLSEETYLAKYLHSTDTQGHPYSNADELAASTVTVLRTFPDQFMREYDALGSKDQARIRAAVGAVYAMLVAQNSDPQAIKGLIPQMGSIRDHLKQSS